MLCFSPALIDWNPLCLFAQLNKYKRLTRSHRWTWALTPILFILACPVFPLNQYFSSRRTRLAARMQVKSEASAPQAKGSFLPKYCELSVRLVPSVQHPVSLAYLLYIFVPLLHVHDPYRPMVPWAPALLFKPAPRQGPDCVPIGECSTSSDTLAGKSAAKAR